jgi:hypothetical protein
MRDYPQKTHQSTACCTAPAARLAAFSDPALNDVSEWPSDFVIASLINFR